MKQFAIIGAALAFFAVAFGAFGAHALRESIPADRLAIFQTGVQYQAMHALALLALGLSQQRRKALTAACWLFVAGVFFFSGSLYALAITGTRWLGAITPVGGVCFLSGWLLVFLALASDRGE